jgi:integrase
MKKSLKVKEPVRIRVKGLNNGCKSIYLDVYKGGKRSYEFLKLYLIPESSPVDKVRNKQTLDMAREIQALRVLDLQRATHGLTGVIGKRQRTPVVAYIASTAEGKNASARYTRSALVALLDDYAPGVTFSDIDKDFCIQFMRYLMGAKNRRNRREVKPLSANTRNGYASLFKTILRCAVADEIISHNPFDNIGRGDIPKPVKAEVSFLTIDEVRDFAAADTPYKSVQEAFLFACYTGLRYSDVKLLTWSQIRGGMVYYRQHKTRKQEYLPLAKPAINILSGKPHAGDNAPVFSLPCSSTTNDHLRNIAAYAGIRRRITFHVSRHTCATLLLSLGVGIEVVSKVLGHSDIATTQIYAKVMADKIREGVYRLDDL